MRGKKGREGGEEGVRVGVWWEGGEGSLKERRLVQVSGCHREPLNTLSPLSHS